MEASWDLRCSRSLFEEAEAEEAAAAATLAIATERERGFYLLTGGKEGREGFMKMKKRRERLPYISLYQSITITITITCKMLYRI